jgi:hypothetical protein
VINTTLIGIDFSIIKSAACILKNDEYIFISWPYNLSETHLEIYKNSPVRIIKRTDIRQKTKNITEKVQFEVENSKYLARLILNVLRQYLNGGAYIAFESLSYGSHGDVILQLSSYKGVLMQMLTEVIPVENIFTFAPTTVKHTAGCSKKGMKKSDMIEVFKTRSTPFSLYLKENEEKFKTKGGKNYIPHLDDFVDAYFVLETLLNHCSLDS